MTKLEQAVLKQDEQFFSNPNLKQWTIAERERNNAKMAFDRAQLELAEENMRHQVAVMKLNRKINNLTVLRKILDGAPGFIRCSQGQLDAQDGFTTIGEVMGYVGQQFVDLSLEPMACPFGMEVWAIDNRGMMTIADALRDSND